MSENILSAAPRHTRPGYEIRIPGECLKIGSSHWTPEQRANGVWVKMVFLTSSEEESVLLEAARVGAALSTTIHVRSSLAAIATSVASQGDDDTRHEPGTYAPVKELDRRGLWEELGAQGRNLCFYAFGQANNPDEKSRSAATQSFRLTG